MIALLATSICTGPAGIAARKPITRAAIMNTIYLIGSIGVMIGSRLSLLQGKGKKTVKV